MQRPIVCRTRSHEWGALSEVVYFMLSTLDQTGMIEQDFQHLQLFSAHRGANNTESSVKALMKIKLDRPSSKLDQRLPTLHHSCVWNRRSTTLDCSEPSQLRGKTQDFQGRTKTRKRVIARVHALALCMAVSSIWPPASLAVWVQTVASSNRRQAKASAICEASRNPPKLRPGLNEKAQPAENARFRCTSMRHEKDVEQRKVAHTRAEAGAKTPRRAEGTRCTKGPLSLWGGGRLGDPNPEPLPNEMAFCV